MKKKKGFTLVELLAVIAILAILVIIALPNVINMYNNARKNSFLTEAKSVFKESANKYMSGSLGEANSSTHIYCRSNTDSLNPLDLSGRKINYYIKTDSSGNVNAIVIWDEDRYVAKKGTKLEAESLDDALTITNDIKNATCGDILEKTGLEKKIDYSKIVLTLGNTQTKILTMTLDTSNQDVGEVKYKVYIKHPDKTIELTSSDYTNKYYLEYNDFTYMDSYIGFEVTAIVNGKEISKKSIGPACFVAGTKVKTETGFKNIEDIKIGDYVYSFNLDANSLELKKVTNSIISQTLETYIMTIGNKTFEVTPRHQLYIIDKGWTRAYDVKIGDKMLDVNGKEIIINNIVNKKYGTPIKTYNLTIEGNNNYFVTDIQVLVHNAGSGTWSYDDIELLK